MSCRCFLISQQGDWGGVQYTDGFGFCLKRSCSGCTRTRILQLNTILLSGPIQGGLYFNPTKVSSSPALFKVVNILQTSPVRRRCPSCQQIIVLTFFQNEFANLSLELTTSLSAGLKDKRWTAGPLFSFGNTGNSEATSGSHDGEFVHVRTT